MPRATLCAVLCAAAAATASATAGELPSNMRAAASESRFEHEPSYYVTPVMVEKAELFKIPDARFVELAHKAEEAPATPAPATPAAGQGAPASTKHAGQAPYTHDVVQGAGGFQMLPGQFYHPGYYHPPTLPYRFPSYPYDNPSYTPFPSNFNVRLPKPWRSDALNIYSDGARYMQNMAHFDSFPTGGYYGGGVGQQVGQQQVIQQTGQDVIG